MKRKKLKQIRITSFMFVLLVIGTACAGNTNKVNNTDLKEKENKEMAKELTKKDFLEKVYNFEANPEEWKFEGNKPCMIDFYATWCGPCKMLSPIVEELSKEYEGKIDVYKIDVDKEEKLAALFGIRSIPTLLFCPVGKQPTMTQGALPKNELKKMIDDILLK